MKLNLGCGYKKKPGFVNVDIQMECEPDVIVNLEKVPWPFENDSVEEVNMEHLLEHIGASTDGHKAILQELYRVCKTDATVRIVFPHPRSDTYLIDPTHVRPITVGTLYMYSKKKCQEYIERESRTTPLAIYWDIDFEVKSRDVVLYPNWGQKYQNGEITIDDLQFAINSYNNVVSETEVILEVIKDKSGDI